MFPDITSSLEIFSTQMTKSSFVWPHSCVCLLHQTSVRQVCIMEHNTNFVLPFVTHILLPKTSNQDLRLIQMQFQPKYTFFKQGNLAS